MKTKRILPFTASLLKISLHESIIAIISQNTPATGAYPHITCTCCATRKGPVLKKAHWLKSLTLTLAFNAVAIPKATGNPERNEAEAENAVRKADGQVA